MNKSTLELILVFLGVLTTVFSVYFYLDAKHKGTEESNLEILELKEELLDRDIKKDAESRVYYKDLEIERGSLAAAEQRRLNYLEEQLDRKYEEQAIIQETLVKLKSGVKD